MPAQFPTTLVEAPPLIQFNCIRAVTFVSGRRCCGHLHALAASSCRVMESSVSARTVHSAVACRPCSHPWHAPAQAPAPQNNGVPTRTRTQTRAAVFGRVLTSPALGCGTGRCMQTSFPSSAIIARITDGSATADGPSLGEAWHARTWPNETRATFEPYAVPKTPWARLATDEARHMCVGSAW